MKVLVVDDEALARSRVLRMLARIADVEVVGEAGNGNEALACIAERSPDLVVLDIEMPGLDGLAVAESPGAPMIVFTTAHPEYAADAFDLEAVDYLIKPLRQERLERALDRARRRRANEPVGEGDGPPHRLAVHAAGGVRFVDARKITSLRALDKYTTFVLDGEQHLLRESLDTLEARLAPLGFVRVHRAGLVRRDAITGLASDDGTLAAQLADGTRVEVSRRHAAELKRTLGVRK